MNSVLSRLTFVLLSFCFSFSFAYAVEAMPASDDPVLEKRVMALSDELRCLVCQNQTLADSNADLAIDLRNQVRAQLKEGKSEREILDYMVKRYGDFVLYRPPVKASTYVLWYGPFILLILGVIVLVIKLRQRRKTMDQIPALSAEEQARAASLLNDTGRGE